MNEMVVELVLWTDCCVVRSTFVLWNDGISYCLMCVFNIMMRRCLILEVNFERTNTDDDH